MAEQRKDGGGLLELEGELTCSICTDLLYAPLTLLDCLHSFCGSCLKEWFAWQATANTRRETKPYTCPSCREPVRETKVDWRLTTLLEGFLKANPDRGKTQEERDEANKQYKRGDNVIPLVQVEEADSDDERLLAEIRELSVRDVGSDTASRAGQRARAHPRTGTDRSPRHRSRRRDHSSHRGMDRDSRERHVEHQPSLRSLLSDSDISSEDVQQEILQAIYAEGLLNDIDVDNLTIDQEEELTERIADIYRTRQWNHDRTRTRGRHETDHLSRTIREQTNSTTSSQSRAGNLPSQQPQQSQTRTRPPISRPHLFEQTPTRQDRSGRRSMSASGHQRQSSSSSIARSPIEHNRHPARSATDLSQPLSVPQQRPRASSGNTRSATDPSTLRNEAREVRHGADRLRPGSSGTSSRPRSRESETSRRQQGTTSSTTGAATASTTDDEFRQAVSSSQSPRAVTSNSALAPEPVIIEQTTGASPPTISCSRCERQHIETELHYHCNKCNDGTFNLCLDCYRSGKGCHHWFGFGFMAMHLWQRQAPPEGQARRNELPHVLMPQRYKVTSPTASTTPYPDTQPRKPFVHQQGAFCDCCLVLANDCYWYCEICLIGAWGFCNSCMLRGNHCTHPLLPLAHISSLQNFTHDPSEVAFLPVPHLKEHSFVLRPILTDCDICEGEIPAHKPRFHCYSCGDGDYDICSSCYANLISTGKISHANGPDGWRRCLRNHRMAVVGYRDTPSGGGKVRVTLADPVGGWRLKESSTSSTVAPVPPQIASGHRYLATWSRFPPREEAGGSVDELTFPQDAEIREGEDLNEDWAVGVYAGKVGVFPRNHFHGRQAGKQAGRQAGRQASRQTGKQPGKRASGKLGKLINFRTGTDEPRSWVDFRECALTHTDYKRERERKRISFHRPLLAKAFGWRGVGK